MKFKRKTKTDPKSVNKPQNSPAVTFITQDTEIKADLKSKDNIRIAGSVEGEVESEQKLILNNTGNIKGSIISPEADISGKVTGDIRVANTLTLRSTAVINGEIFTKKLTIEDGAQLKGTLQVGPEVDVNKGSKQKTPGTKSSDSSPAASLLKKAQSESKSTEDDASEDNSKSKSDASSDSSDSGSTKLSA